MQDDNTQPQVDGYYGDDDTDSEDIDLSFLDENEEDTKK
jgi:hypothetical protein